MTHDQAMQVFSTFNAALPDLTVEWRREGDDFWVALTVPGHGKQWSRTIESARTLWANLRAWQLLPKGVKPV